MEESGQVEKVLGGRMPSRAEMLGSRIFLTKEICTQTTAPIFVVSLRFDSEFPILPVLCFWRLRKSEMIDENKNY